MDVSDLRRAVSALYARLSGAAAKGGVGAPWISPALQPADEALRCVAPCERVMGCAVAPLCRALALVQEHLPAMIAGACPEAVQMASDDCVALLDSLDRAAAAVSAAERAVYWEEAVEIAQELALLAAQWGDVR